MKLVLLLFGLLTLKDGGATKWRRGGGGGGREKVAMGIDDETCDDGQTNIFVDWPSEHPERCETGEWIHLRPTAEKISCLEKDEIDTAWHHCMDELIIYEDVPPRGGPHRPNWPVYGEYYYIPPQRWVHALEHGALVFLYDPCISDHRVVEAVKDIVRSCLRKHVITPYAQLEERQPMAFLTYGCKLIFSHIDRPKLIEFIRENALSKEMALESMMSTNGRYDYFLKKESRTVEGSNYEDENLCPNL